MEGYCCQEVGSHLEEGNYYQEVQEGSLQQQVVDSLHQPVGRFLEEAGVLEVA